MRELLRSIIFCLLACAAVTVSAWFAIGKVRDVREATLTVRASRNVELTTERLLVALRESEVSEFRYLLTQQSEYQASFDKSSAVAAALAAALETFTAPQAQQGHRAREVTALVTLKLEQMSASMELGRRGDWAAALAATKTPRDEEAMDQIRALGTQIEVTSDDSIRLFRAQVDHATENVVAGVIVTSALSVVLLALLTYFSRRDGRQLRESAEQLAITLRSIGDAVVTTDAYGNVTYLNPIAAALSQRELPVAPTLFNELFRLVDEATGVAAKNPVAQVLKDGKTIGLANHTALVRPDGSSLTIEDTAAPLRDENGGVRGVVFVFKDISERRVAEKQLEAARVLLESNVAELRSSEEELRTADRRKDEFLATLAHELRNPVAPIKHAIALLDNDQLPPEQQRWARAVITRQVAQMGRLLDDLLDSARVSRGELSLKPTNVELKSVMTDALDAAELIIERKGHFLSISWPDPPLTLHVDGVRIAQVLSNLLTNAAKYTDPGGRIAIKAHLSPDEVSISVKDSGLGLSAESLPHVFDMFSQIHSARDRSEGGLGIGLSLARHLMELHGGRLEVASDGEGRGSTFTMVLPASCAQVHQPEPVAENAPVTRGNASRLVLLIDDNADAAVSLGMLLELSGNEVLIAHTGEEGLVIAREHRPMAVIVDIGLPGIDGYEVARTLRQEAWARSLLLIALTGWGQTADKAEAEAAGFDHHLTKPTDPDTVQLLLSSR